jgi:hypothetical protein
MLWRKNAKSMQSQLALRRINHRRTTELSSANWALPESETNKWFPVKSHVHAIGPFTDAQLLREEPARVGDEMWLNPERSGL